MIIGSDMPDKRILIWTLPIFVVLENDRLGKEGFTVWWRSCSHGASAGPGAGGGKLYNISL